LIVIKEWFRVGDFKDDLWFGEGIGQFESGVAGIFKGLGEEGVELCLE
jgi:hypothetical protein